VSGRDGVKRRLSYVRYTQSAYLKKHPSGRVRSIGVMSGASLMDFVERLLRPRQRFKRRCERLPIRLFAVLAESAQRAVVPSLQRSTRRGHITFDADSA